MPSRCRRLPGWRAEIIGADRSRADSPDTRFVRGVRDAARVAGVTLHGYRDHPEVLAALAGAAIVVVPSRWQEPFGLTALEAMASGAALICSPRGGLPEVAGDAALYADPDDPAALADAILALACDGAQRDQPGGGGVRTRPAVRSAANTCLASIAAPRDPGDFSKWPGLIPMPVGLSARPEGVGRDTSSGALP